MHTKLLSVLWITLYLCASHSLAKTAKANFSLPTWTSVQMTSKTSLRGSAIKEQSLWVTGSNNSVFVSQDGGATWKNRSVPQSVKLDFRDIALFDKHTAIVMGAGSDLLSVLYKTIDGGKTWQLLYQNTDKTGFFNSVAFWDSKQGLLIGDPVDGYFVVKKTNDGGKTWRRISIGGLPKKQSKESVFAASGNSIIVGTQGKAWIATGGYSASVYSSSDYGETWQRSSAPIYRETQTAGGYAMAINQAEQPFILGGDYLDRTMKYNNMASLIANQWQTTQTGNHGLRTAMSCQSNTCISTGKTSSDISLDSGRTWQVLKGQGFYTLSSDKGVFIAAGANGTVGIMDLTKKLR